MMLPFGAASTCPTTVRLAPTAQVWETLRSSLDGQTATVAITPDGRRIVSGSHDHRVRIWDLASGQLERTLKGHTDQVLSVAVTPDGSRIVSAGKDRTVRIWELASGRL